MNSDPRGRCGLRVLVVDDDPLSAAVQSQLVRLLGHDAHTETDGTPALRRALEERFDLLFLDLEMPAADGFELLRRLREAERADDRPPLPVIAVTGYAAPADRERCLEAGFSGHLHKPVLIGLLQAQIAATLGRAGADGDSDGDDSSDAARLRTAVQRLGRIGQPGAFTPTATEAFALRSAQLADALRSAIARRDGEGAVHAAQALASSARFLGTTALAACAAELEALAAGQHWAAAQDRLREFDEQHQAVLTALFQFER